MVKKQKTKKRKIEVYKLTVSELQEKIGYGYLIERCLKSLPNKGDRVLDTGAKSHLLYSASLTNNILKMQFLSFTTGFRPDILDTNNYAVSTTPLKETQTNVEWTHCYGGKKNGQYILLVEYVQSGIRPTTIERYLQWLFDQCYVSAEPLQNDERLVCSLEAVAGEAFINHVDNLSRIKKATYRIVRPNPGWGDLENDLGEQAQDSSAHKADIVMTAVRSKSLSFSNGIVQAIKDAFGKGKLDYAKVVGERDGQEESFDTIKYGKSSYLAFNVDPQGQVEHSDAWSKMGQYFDELE